MEKVKVYKVSWHTDFIVNFNTNFYKNINI